MRDISDASLLDSVWWSPEGWWGKWSSTHYSRLNWEVAKEWSCVWSATCMVPNQLERRLKSKFLDSKEGVYPSNYQWQYHDMIHKCCFETCSVHCWSFLGPRGLFCSIMESYVHKLCVFIRIMLGKIWQLWRTITGFFQQTAKTAIMTSSGAESNSGSTKYSVGALDTLSYWSHPKLSSPP